MAARLFQVDTGCSYHFHLFRNRKHFMNSLRALE